MFCSLCRNENLMKSNFCGFCGNPLSKLPQNLAEECPLEKDLPKDFLFTEIPKPEGDISDAGKSINEAETLINKIRDENSPEHLKKIFEDAEFILDEILVEKKPDEFETSKPIIKPSLPLMNK